MVIVLKLEQAKETYFEGIEGNTPKCIHHDSYFGEDGCHSKAVVTTIFCGERWFACREHKKKLNQQWEGELAEDAELPEWETIKTECSWCSQDLSQAEVLSPRTSDDGEIICDGCYRQEYLRICVICEDYFREKETRYIVVEGENRSGGKLEKAVYEIVDTPWYVDGVFSAEIIADSLEKVRDLDEEELQWTVSGKVCEDCATRNSG